eukprot:gene17298-biopygen11931
MFSQRRVESVSKPRKRNTVGIYSKERNPILPSVLVKELSDPARIPPQSAPERRVPPLPASRRGRKRTTSIKAPAPPPGAARAKGCQSPYMVGNGGRRRERDASHGTAAERECGEAAVRESPSPHRESQRPVPHQASHKPSPRFGYGPPRPNHGNGQAPR